MKCKSVITNSTMELLESAYHRKLGRFSTCNCRSFMKVECAVFQWKTICNLKYDNILVEHKCGHSIKMVNQIESGQQFINFIIACCIHVCDYHCMLHIWNQNGRTTSGNWLNSKTKFQLIKSKHFLAYNQFELNPTIDHTTVVHRYSKFIKTEYSPINLCSILINWQVISVINYKRHV